MALIQHQFYVYHEENRVMARKRGEAPVVALTLESAQDAHDKVQEIVNPDGIKHDDPSLEGIGFHHLSFQAKISENCREFVEAAYAKA